MATIASLLHSNTLPTPTAYATPEAVATGSSAASSSSSSSSASGALDASDALANEQTFLQLLVSQLQNQDPTDPMDGTQFVTQLAQFSSLEQELAMRQDLDKMAGAVTTSTTSTGGSGGTGSGSDSSANAISNNKPANPVQ
jgi:flagellar basal-body rod modification protein FlgD